VTYQSVNPYNGKVFRKYPELDEAQLEQAIATRAPTNSRNARRPGWASYGRDLGAMGIQQFVKKKLVRIVDSRAPA